MGLFRIQGYRTAQCTHCAVAWAPDNALACVARTKLHVSRGEQQMILGDNFLQSWLVSLQPQTNVSTASHFNAMCLNHSPLSVEHSTDYWFLYTPAIEWQQAGKWQSSSGGHFQSAKELQTCSLDNWTSMNSNFSAILVWPPTS